MTTTTDIVTGTYIRPPLPADSIVDGEGWVWQTDYVDDRATYRTVVIYRGEIRLGQLTDDQVDPESVGPVNRAQVRGVVRRIHAELGRAKTRTSTLLAEVAWRLEAAAR